MKKNKKNRKNEKEKEKEKEKKRKRNKKGMVGAIRQGFKGGFRNLGHFKRKQRVDQKKCKK